MAATRELFALAVLPLLVGGIIWLPGWAFLVVLAAACLVAGDEMLAMARGAGVPCGRWLPLLLLAALMGASWWQGVNGLVAVAVLSLILLPAAQLSHPQRPHGALAATAVASFTVLYVGCTAVCLGLIRGFPADGQGFRLLLFFLGTIWAGDSGAYYVGKNLGRHKMSPRISPNKTLEGLAGGMVASIAIAAVLKPVFGVTAGWPHIFALAAILAVAAPLGDLVESQFKRDTGVKDSSTLLPGHGGLLDRTDSLLFAAPPFLAYLMLVGLAG